MNPESEPAKAGGEHPVHWFQKLLDNPWLLLALGIGVPTLSYTVWGLVELALLKRA